MLKIRRSAEKTAGLSIDRAAVLQLKDEANGPAYIARELTLARRSVYRILEKAQQTISSP